VDALVDGGELLRQRHVEGPTRYQYPLQKQCLQLVLISPVQGYLTAPISKTVQRLGLRSVVEVLPSVQKGQFLSQTSDLNTAAGYVLLVHESSDQIEEDRRRIREAEESGQLYLVSPSPLPESPLCSPHSPNNALRYTSPVMQSMEKAEEVWEDAAAGVGIAASAGAVPIDGESAAFKMSGL